MSSKLLIVDDSALMRKHLSRLFEAEGDFQVSTARNGREAVELALELEPDVMTLDINMPEMDGLTALSLIMAQRPTPVIMVSSLTEQGAMATLEALALGAVDYIAKPSGTISLSMGDAQEILVAKVRTALRARIDIRPGNLREQLRRDRARLRAEAEVRPRVGADGLVLIGVSTGGPRTLEAVLPQLPENFPWPVVVAQHMPLGFTEAFARRMDGLCCLPVREIRSPTPLRPGHIYIGRGDADVIITERRGEKLATARPIDPGHVWHPSVDLLVASALQHYPAQQLIGIQLTGMGSDGALAMTELKKQGGRTIAESEETAVVFGMPMELIRRQGASLVLPCHQVAAQLKKWLY